MREIKHDETEQADETGKTGKANERDKTDKTEQADEIGKTGKAK